MSIVLAYDTETTGLPLWNEPSEHPDQPRVLELAAELFDDATGETLASVNTIIQPDGWTVSQEITEITGITQEQAVRYGIPMDDVLPVFMGMWEGCEYRIAHNESFDMRMIRIELMRHPDFRDVAINRGDKSVSMPDIWKAGLARCTQALSTPILNLPPTERMLRAGRKHAKSPNLGEAYRHFFGTGLEGAHRAAVDVAACKAIYLEIIKRQERAA